MAIRGARVLIFGATLAPARRLVEAYLALGAEVVAADVLRTRLEELRAEMGQHERLWVAESGGGAGMEALFADVARDAPVDLVVLVTEAPSSAAVTGLLRCAEGRVADPGRVLVLALGAPPSDALPTLRAAPQGAGATGVFLGTGELDGAMLQRLVELSDPERECSAGWLGAAAMIAGR